MLHEPLKNGMVRREVSGTALNIHVCRSRISIIDAIHPPYSVNEKSENGCSFWRKKSNNTWYIISTLNSHPKVSNYISDTKKVNQSFNKLFIIK